MTMTLGPAIRPRSHLVVLSLILLLAGGLRWFGVSYVGYWTDELCSLSSTDGWGLQLYELPTDRIISVRLPVRTRLSDAAPIGEIPGALARDDTHPPVYLLLLRLWEGAFGDAEAATRSLNICFSLVAIFLVFVAARESVGSAAALWAALLMAVASPQIMFSLEARDYMPAVTFSLGATVALLRLSKTPTKLAAATFALMLLLAMMTHYYSAGIAAALVLHALLWMRGRSQSLVLLGAVVAGMLFMVIWGPHFFEEIPNFKTNTAWLFDPGPGHLSRWWFRLCRVPGMLIAADLPDCSTIPGLLFFYLPVAYTVRPELRLWVLWIFCTVGLIAGQDLVNSTTQLTLPRYLLFATPAAYVLLAGALRGKLRWLPPAAGVLTALLCLRSAYLPAWKIDLRTPVDVVAHRIQPDDGLVITGPDRIFDGITYAAFQHYLPKMPVVSAVLTQPADAPTLDRLHRCPHVWVLSIWTNKSIGEIIPGFAAPPIDQIQLPYFGDLMHGQVRSDGSLMR